MDKAKLTSTLIDGSDGLANVKIVKAALQAIVSTEPHISEVCLNIKVCQMFGYGKKNAIFQGKIVSLKDKWITQSVTTGNFELPA